MRAVEEMLEWESGRAVCRLRIRSHHPLVCAGRFPTASVLEFLAQGVAACLGYEAYLGGSRVRVGMIVSVRRFEVTEPFLPIGTELTVLVESIHSTDDVSTFRGEARAEGRPIAHAHMTVVHPEAPPPER
jgi:predicted hotdog family 3-hydroxylacyl-ACP dehydratase